MSAKRLLKDTRRFGRFPGKIYRFAGSFHNYSEARNEALRHRNNGKLARMTFRKSADAYEVWTR